MKEGLLDILRGFAIMVVVVTIIAGIVLAARHEVTKDKAEFAACREAGYSDILYWNMRYCVTVTENGHLIGEPLDRVLEANDGK